MELVAKGQFYRNLSGLNNRKLMKAIYDTLKQVQQADNISEIHHLRKLKNFDVHYRIKVANDYRIGVVIRGRKVWFTCFGHRSNFYKKFP